MWRLLLLAIWLICLSPSPQWGTPLQGRYGDKGDQGEIWTPDSNKDRRIDCRDLGIACPSTLEDQSEHRQ